MHPVTRSKLRSTRLAMAGLAFVLSAGAACAGEVPRGIEQALNTAQQEKKGITLYVAGQAVAGAVTRLEPGQWVELRNQQYSRIVVRLDRIDGIAAP